MLIRSKREFYNLAMCGLCGNTPRMWEDVYAYLEDWVRDDAPEYIGIRQLSIGGLCWPRINVGELVSMCGPKPSGIVTEIPPSGAESGKGLQGELSWINGSWYLYYTHELGYMRDKLRESGQHARGWQVLRLLAEYCSASEYEEVFDLFEKYTVGTEYPTIEFAVFRRPWGRLNRNTIIWEIRNGY